MEIDGKILIFDSTDRNFLCGDANMSLNKSMIWYLYTKLYWVPRPVNDDGVNPPKPVYKYGQRAGDGGNGVISRDTLEIDKNHVINGFLQKRIKLEEEDGSPDEVDLNDDVDLANEFINDVHGDQQPEMPQEEIAQIFRDEEQGIIMLHMDIREPLSTLKFLLEQRLNTTLSEYGFCLQDAQMLESHKNLVDQCVQGEGLVQINVQLKVDLKGEKKINIVDVLKPAEEYVEIGNANGDEDEPESGNNALNNDQDRVVRWVVDANFKKDQIKLNIPEDPIDWDVPHVRHWLLWAVRQFNLSGIKLNDWMISGTDLCNMSLKTFHTKVPNDPGNSFWTHIELLRKCKIVAIKPKAPVVKQEIDEDSEMLDEEDGDDRELFKSRIEDKVIRMGKQPKVFYVDPDACTSPTTSLTRVGNNNGQIQLWQFLLELLTDKNHRDAIQWLETEGEFKLINPELVAQLWGVRKNKPTMNYEKLSRALRYYYDGDMIAKVHGKRFVYKFVCDLKQLLGYSANELNALVVEAELNAKHNKNLNSPLHTIFNSDYIAMMIP